MKAFYLGVFFTALAFLTCTASYASSSCSEDAQQIMKMYKKKKSVVTPNCSLNFGDTSKLKIESISEENTFNCTALCKITGSSPKKCSWDKGNWGDTLTCR